MCNSTKCLSNTNNHETNNEKILESSNLQHAPTTQESTATHETSASGNHQSSPVESAQNNYSASITHWVSAMIPSEKTDNSTTKISAQKKHSDKMEKNLSSSKLVCSPDKPRHENITKGVHEKL